MLKGQDVLLLLKLLASNDDAASFNRLALELSMSPAEVHQAAKRAEFAGLLALIPEGRCHAKKVNRRALVEFLLHGMQYVFPPVRGPVTRGIPTSFGAPCFPKLISGDELPPVWPAADGAVRGLSFSPLYRSVPIAAQRDPALYQLLVLVDALRGGKAREREVAKHDLLRRLQHDE